MPCFAISIRGDKENLLKDSEGLLFYTKKSLAVEACEEMNLLCKKRKSEQIYEVCKVTENDWKTYKVIYDQENEDDDARRDVQRYTKRTDVHGGSGGSKGNTKDSKRSPKECDGSTQALPF